MAKLTEDLGINQRLSAIMRCTAIVLAVGLSALVSEPKVGANRWSVAFVHKGLSGVVPEEFLRGAPAGQARASLWLANAAIAQGKPRTALDLLADSPSFEHRDALRLQAQAYLALGDSGRAIAALEAARDYLSLSKYARDAQATGRLDEAEIAYFAAWRVEPEAGTIPLANFLWRVQRRPGEAERILRSSMSIGEVDGVSWARTLGLVLQAQAKWEDAISAYQHALIEDPSNLYTLALLGRAYLYGEGDDAHAREVFERMILISPKSGDGFFAMGELMAFEKKPQIADSWYREAIQRSPDEPMWWVQRANTARDSGDTPRAIDLYEQGSKVFPNFSLLQFELAKAYQTSGDLERAIAAIESAIKNVDRPNASYYVRAGGIYESAGRIDDARLAYLHAINSDPGNSPAHQAARQALAMLIDARK